MSDGRHLDRISSGVFIISAHRGQPRRFADDARGRRMVRMGIIPMRSEEDSGAILSQSTHDRLTTLLIQCDVSIWQSKIHSRVEAHHARSIERLLRTNLRIAARSHLTTCQIDDARAITKRLEFA